MKTYTSFFALLVLSASTFAQQFSLPYALTESSDYSALTQKYDLNTIDELKVLDERIVEYGYDASDNLMELFYYHEVMYVNSEEAIDANNKVFIPINASNELVDVDCRVVLPNKESIRFSKSALQEGIDENQRKVYYFAVSGAEKGCYIEHFYLIKRHPKYKGEYFNMQGTVAVAKSVFGIISPDNLLFATKSVNGYSDFITDSSLTNRNYLRAVTFNIPKLEEEHFANEGGNKMKVVFQLYSNKNTGKKNIFNYGVLSQDIFESIAIKPSKYVIKEIDKILSISEIKYAKDEAARILKIENFIKQHFAYTESGEDRFQNLDDIFKLKAFNEFGATLLFYSIYERAGIEKEIVMTSDRYDIKFDKSFDSWAYINTYCLYFPSIDKYLLPSSMHFRLGLIPYGYVNNYGLFISKVSLGGIETGVGKVKFIDPLPAGSTQQNIVASVALDPTKDSLIVDFNVAYSGYYAQGYQCVFDVLENDKVREFEEALVKGFVEEIKIRQVAVENKGAANLTVNPLEVKSTFSSAQLIDKVDGVILLKIGELIGPQAELYQAKDRVQPVENDFNREYHREITFTVPEGYSIKNISDLHMAIQPFIASGDGAGFVSDYTLNADKLTVKVYEYYPQICFSKEEYDKYRAVVNAAADFNKIVLVLEKKI